MEGKIATLAAVLATVFAGSALAAVPAGYPAEYQKIVDAATKEGKVVIYSTTDTKAAGPLIKGFEEQYPGIKVEYNDMNSTELYNRYHQRAGLRRRQRRRGLELVDGHRAEAGDRLRRRICFTRKREIAEMGGLAG